MPTASFGSARAQVDLGTIARVVAAFPAYYGGIQQSSKTSIGLVDPPSIGAEGGLGPRTGLKRPGATLPLLVGLHRVVCAAGLLVAFAQLSSTVVSPDFELRGLAGRSHLFTSALLWFPSARTRDLAVVRGPS